MLAVATREDGVATLTEPLQLRRGGYDMFFNSDVRPRSLLAGGAALVAGAAVWLALADRNARRDLGERSAARP